ncbi:Inositol-pentakisphosphate 2-kinase [Phlyctema vagabunda]|uniref:Inositol-pentakisphosphate 2-kinase n=1 Tax=Phlyctema vagabunda TaxID=108571 RepID=A0ABR4PNS5_9HELO
MALTTDGGVPKLEELFPKELKWLYVAEGAANVVYEVWQVVLPHRCSNGEMFPAGVKTGSFLRLRKDLPTTIPCIISQRNFDRVFRPLFKPEHLVDQQLINIKSSRVVERLNADLRKWEHGEKLEGQLKSGLPNVRPAKRKGIYLADDDHGLLVTDMSSRGKSVLVIEFKPKWLLQSPSAPKGAVRCRTCARNALHDVKEKSKGRPTNPSETQIFCPLDLTSVDLKVLYNVACQILPANAKLETALRLARWLRDCDLIRDLRAAQKHADIKGVLEGTANNEDLLVAMTLRDCSLYLHLPTESSLPIEARLGDLDLKSRDKADKWKEAERCLIEDGWYQGTEKVVTALPNQCALNKSRSLPYTVDEKQFKRI